MNCLIDMFYKIKYKIIKNYDIYYDKPTIGDRVNILRCLHSAQRERHISHINKGYKSIYSRKKYIVIANINDNIYVLDDDCIYRYYEIKYAS